MMLNSDLDNSRLFKKFLYKTKTYSEINGNTTGMDLRTMLLFNNINKRLD